MTQMVFYKPLRCWKLITCLSPVLYCVWKKVLTRKRKRESDVKVSGLIESWEVSGCEDGYPVIWLSTDIADYDCQKPAANYKKIYDHFFEKARVCVEVYKKLTKSSGGLDMLSKKTDGAFADIPVLTALRDESLKHGNFVQAKLTSAGGNLNIGLKLGDNEMKINQTSLNTSEVEEEDEDKKLARLLQEEEYWQSMKQKKNQGAASLRSKYYIKINEDEIADDYPWPAYYKNSVQETDEFIIFDSDFDVYESDDLPQSMLHNWSLYNLDSRLISLELPPMKPCSDIDVTILWVRRYDFR
ncbi:DNA (cytosine-5)-methyltransferase [Quillaja saponaria]|uniref:DNA (Cytosine-5)-methyltransferase n=1 Tax=Quillaja saponaria TaxID=32244 RepID=A0AAD7QJU0_QUISA|nr:DNA (cytosine-5)-methyltransferase [Quillaja saponaria]